MENGFDRTGMSVKRLDPSVIWSAVAIGALMPGLAAVYPLLRYSGVIPAGGSWGDWPLSLDISLPTLAIVAIYIAGHWGVARPPDDRWAALRHVSFFGGVGAVFVALQSPIERISDHLFIVHQIEHMLLRTTGPLLIMLAAPQAALLRGLPSWARRRIIAPVFGSRIWRALGIFGHPAVATVLFVGTTYFWMIPRFHDLAILDEPIHYLWHTTLLLSGLIFFWRILDPRPYPLGASLGTRLLMFWLSSIGNILLGSYLSFKHLAIYPAYSEMGRLWGISAIIDERYGGLTMWIPGSMMFAATAMLMIYRWAEQEERAFARLRTGAAAAPAVTAVSLAAQRRAANRKTAIGLLGFVATVLAITLISTGIYHYAGAYEHAAFSNPVVR